MKQKSLIVVESPSKARTIEQYLENEFEVIACVGHVKDLPSNKLGIDIENNFEMTLDVLPKRKDFIKELKKKSKLAERVYIASDPDREGEAIAAHLASEVPKDKLERVEFTEITQAGIKEGMGNSRKLDDNLISSQKTRRIIDRLVGYKVSPVLWATLQKNMNFVNTTLSAGRVQSACVKILIERDRKRQKYSRTEYFGLKVKLKKNQSEIDFDALLNKIDGKAIVSSNDFDSDTGKLKNSEALILNKKEAEDLISNLGKGKWVVSSINEKPRTSNPKPPFTTSTLQQEAARKLRFSAKNTMRVAQQLYENGFITYMRTDSINLSNEALNAARSEIKSLYGESYLPKNARQYKSKGKNTQEAHEAIRPAGSKFKHPESLKNILNEQEFKLYNMIWKRTVASQMKSAQLEQTTIQISDGKHTFETKGKIIVFPGFLKAYVESSDNPKAKLDNAEQTLPPLNEGDALNCNELIPKQHFTKPINRFTEASLVKELETLGIGRPSTYATIMKKIQDKGYVRKIKGAMIPTFTGYAIVQFLEKYFDELVDLHQKWKMIWMRLQ